MSIDELLKDYIKDFEVGVEELVVIGWVFIVLWRFDVIYRFLFFIWIYVCFIFVDKVLFKGIINVLMNFLCFLII